MKCYLSGTISDNDILLEYAKLGSYCEWDLFGIEVSLYQANPTFFMPSDQQRIRAIKLLLDNGYEDSVVIAHDVHTKHRLVFIIIYIVAWQAGGFSMFPTTCCHCGDIPLGLGVLFLSVPSDL